MLLFPIRLKSDGGSVTLVPSDAAVGPVLGGGCPEVVALGFTQGHGVSV